MLQRATQLPVCFLQNSQQRATYDFYFLDSHPELGARVWCYMLPDGRQQGPVSLAQLYPMAHNTGIPPT